MDLGHLPGYRWAIQGQYDARFHGMGVEDALRLAQRCDAYMSRVTMALQLPDAGRHLDLGCGSGLAALAVARARPGMRVVGLDGSTRALDLARQVATCQGVSNVDWFEGDAESPPPGPFDRATALSLFNLLPDKASALSAWRRAMTGSGRLVLTDGFTSGPGTRGGSGPLRDGAFTAMLRATGWRSVRREDLTPLVRRLNEAGAWAWPEYLRPGVRYLLHALEPA